LNKNTKPNLTFTQNFTKEILKMDIRKHVGSSKFIKHADLEGRPHTVTIASCEVEKIGLPGNEDFKPVLSFVGREKRLVLNTTNANSIVESFGHETESWINRQIELYPDRTQFQGRSVDCVRVRVPAEVPPPAGSSARAVAAGITAEVESLDESPDGCPF